MTNIIALTDLCKWNLKAGSHEWPGPRGGTCINEAAIVAAGFEYKSVATASDCPPCFSPVISAYLIQLNDHLDDVERQQLIRFVTRLSGSRDTDAIEKKRLEFMIIETVRRIVSVAMTVAELPECATKCSAVQTITEASAASAKAATEANIAANAAYRAYIAIHASYKAVKASHIAHHAGNAGNIAAKAAKAADIAVDRANFTYADQAANAANIAANVAANSGTMIKKAIAQHCIEIVEGALAIGNQATDIDAALVVARMAESRLRKGHYARST